MSTAVAKPQTAVAPNPNQAFRTTVQRISQSLLVDWVGPERAAEATGRIVAALAAAANGAKKPEDFFACTPQSVGVVVALSALTGIMVGTGSTALAYAIPRRPRKSDPMQLNYQLSHRGLCALVQRSGQTIIPIPIGFRDDIEVDETGSCVIRKIDIDDPPQSIEDLRGVVVRISRGKEIVFSGWVPRSTILKRRDGSDAYQFAERNDWAKESDPWHKWGVEMACKTAIHYAVARGWCVIADIESQKAIAMDADDTLPGIVEARSEPSKLEALTEQIESRLEAAPLAELQEALDACGSPEAVLTLVSGFRTRHESDPDLCDQAARMADARCESIRDAAGKVA